MTTIQWPTVSAAEGGGPAEPWTLDFRTLGTDSSGVGTWVVGGKTIEVNALGTGGTLVDVDATGLGGDHTSGAGEVTIDLAELDASINLVDGIYAFALECSADPPTGVDLGMTVGSGVYTGQATNPRLAGISREATSNRIKVFGARGIGAAAGSYAWDLFTAHTPATCLAMGLIVNRARSHTGHFHASASPAGLLYPGAMSNRCDGWAPVAAGYTTAVDGENFVHLFWPAGCRLLRFAAWDVDALLRTP